MAEEEEALAASLVNDDPINAPNEPLEKDHKSDADVQGQEQPTQGDEEPDQTKTEKEVIEEEVAEDAGQAEKDDDLGHVENEVIDEKEELVQAEKEATPTKEPGQKHQEVVPTDPEDDRVEEELDEGNDNIGELEEEDDQAKEAEMECEEEHPEEAEVQETEIEKETTPVVQARKGRREPTIATRTIPSRKARSQSRPQFPSQRSNR